jgi:hypothetical protein
MEYPHIQYVLAYCTLSAGTYKPCVGIHTTYYIGHLLYGKTANCPRRVWHHKVVAYRFTPRHAQRVANPRPGSHDPHTPPSSFLWVPHTQTVPLSPLLSGFAKGLSHALFSSSAGWQSASSLSPCLILFFSGTVGLTDLHSFSVSVGWQPCTLLLVLYSDSPVPFLCFCRVKALYFSSGSTFYDSPALFIWFCRVDRSVFFLCFCRVTTLYSSSSSAQW